MTAGTSTAATARAASGEVVGSERQPGQPAARHRLEPARLEARGQARCRRRPERRARRRRRRPHREQRAGRAVLLAQPAGQRRGDRHGVVGAAEHERARREARRVERGGAVGEGGRGPVEQRRSSRRPRVRGRARRAGARRTGRAGVTRTVTRRPAIADRRPPLRPAGERRPRGRPRLAALEQRHRAGLRRVPRRLLRAPASRSENTARPAASSRGSSPTTSTVDWPRERDAGPREPRHEHARPSSLRRKGRGRRHLPQPRRRRSPTARGPSRSPRRRARPHGRAARARDPEGGGRGRPRGGRSQVRAREPQLAPPPPPTTTRAPRARPATRPPGARRAPAAPPRAPPPPARSDRCAPSRADHRAAGVRELRAIEQKCVERERKGPGGAWITAGLAGPCKGPPGTRGWSASRAGRSWPTASRCPACPSTRPPP